MYSNVSNSIKGNKVFVKFVNFGYNSRLFFIILGCRVGGVMFKLEFIIMLIFIVIIFLFWFGFKGF